MFHVFRLPAIPYPSRSARGMRIPLAEREGYNSASWLTISLADTPAAVHRKHRAGDEACLVRTQKDRRVRAILWPPRPLPQRLLAAQELADRVILHGAGRHRRVRSAEHPTDLHS